MNLYEYEINNKGIIYIDKNKFLHFTFSTAILMDIIDKFFKKVKEDIIYYKGDNSYLKDKYFTNEEGITIIYLRKFTYMIKSEYLYEKDYLQLFKERGNWKFKEGNEIDFLYIQGPEFLFKDKSLWNIKTKIVNKLNKDDLTKIKKDKLKEIVNNKFLNNQLSFTLNKKFNPLIAKDFIEKNKVIIMKPTEGYSGKGITIIKNFNDFEKRIKELKKLKNKDNWSNKLNKKNDFISNLYWVLETYIQHPYLYNNKKFHFRIYYIYTSQGNGYIYDKHRLAIAEEDFKLDDFDNKKIHDTHFVVKDDVKIIFLKDILEEENYNNVMDQILMIFKDITINLKAKPYPESDYGFQIFAADLMLRKDLSVKLIEINTNPGFNKDAPQPLEIFNSCLVNIIDNILPPKNDIEKYNNFVPVYLNNINNINLNNLNNRSPLGLNNKELSFIDEIANAWYEEGFGPKSKKDKTGGYYLSCKEGKLDDFHIHLVGPEGKYHKNSWSRKVKERRKWELLDFRLTPKEQAYHIYVKSEFRKNKDCNNYFLKRKLKK